MDLTAFDKELSFLTKKLFSIKDTGLSYRTINNWSKKGLISHLRQCEGKWHTLSLLELVEIQIYKELKTLGFSIKKLTKVKNAFYVSAKEYDGIPETDIPYLKPNFIYLVENILGYLYGGKIYLLLNANADNVFFVDESSLLEMLIENTSPTNKINKDYGNSLIIINLKNIIEGSGIKMTLFEKDLPIIVKAILKKGDTDSEINIFKTKGGRIKKIKTITHRKLEKGESLNKLVKKPRQKTTIFSNNNGDLGIQIEEEIK